MRRCPHVFGAARAGLKLVFGCLAFCPYFDVGVLEREVISDDERRVLCSGFWGLSRHINYLGEVLMAQRPHARAGLSRSDPRLGLYPLYYVVLLSTRQADDDRRCRDEYGKVWEGYERRVPWRIVPGVF